VKYAQDGPTPESRDLAEMCRIPEPEGTDEELVREALRSFRQLAGMFRYGGLAYEYKLARTALDAFERILEPKLPGFS
jgi:hypothetical protein